MIYRTLIIVGTLLTGLYIYSISNTGLSDPIPFLAILLCLFSLIQIHLAEKNRSKVKKTQEELIENNLRLESIFSHSALGIWLADKDGNLIDANPKFQEMLGFAKEELLGISFLEFTNRDDFEKDKDFFRQQLKGKLPYTKEKRFRRKDGSIFIGKLCVSFVLDPSGDVSYAIANVEDITKEKLLKKDLEESKKRYRDLVAYSPEPIVVHRKGQIIFANNKAASLLGMSIKEILQRRIYDFISQSYHKKTNEVLTELQETWGETEIRNLTISAPNGRKITIEMTHKAIEYEGEPSILAIFRDVTARRKLEKSLRKANERYRFITENSKDMIAFLSPTGVYDFISASCRETLGFEPNELIGKNVFSFLHEDDVEKFEQRRLLLDEKKEDYFSLLYRYKIKNGGFIWLETVAKSLRNDKGEVESILAVSRDATQRMEKEASLESANDFLKMLSSMDGLTGIPNRRYMEESLEKEWERNKLHGTPLSAIMLDIDCFKQYNDTFGHLAGDDALKRVASTIRETVKRPRDLAARYGGEEFIVLLPETDTAGAMMIADTIRKTVRDLQIPHSASAVDEVVTVCAGYATIVPDNQFSPHHLLSAADAALYKAKRAGKNTNREKKDMSV
ncbi:GGDEF domain-containing protein [Bacillus sp. EB01]|uniref:GGDEF domain-containing protein n=1 Tax=Bacillus sp. EB01 TaxID=1347086 RepID=UPI0006932CE2|nr:PAS domain S-box protein [Bacillus sp. EB01]